MPSIGHAAVGLAGGRVAAPTRRGQLAWTVVLVAASYAPDLDVLAFRFGIPYGAPFGHRGAMHSLAFAVFCGLILFVVARLLGVPPLRVFIAVSVVMATHGVLDAFTDGGRGVAIVWPFSQYRWFAPWRPIPVAPLGVAALSERGLRVMLREGLLFFPVFAVAVFPRRWANREP